MNTNVHEIFRKTTTRVKSISIHPLQPVFITGNRCGMIYLWDINYLRIIESIKGHEGCVRCVAFHPSGEIFASCGDDKIVRIWNYKTRMLVSEFKGHRHSVRSLNFHLSETWIVSGSEDCTVKIWNYNTGEIISSSSGHNYSVMSVAFLNEKSMVSASLDQTINKWSIGKITGNKGRGMIDKLNNLMVPKVILDSTIDAHNKGINCLYVSGDTVLSGGDDEEIKMWINCEEGLEYEKSYYMGEGNVTDVYYNKEGETIAVSENGWLFIAMRGRQKKMYLGSRLWAVNANKKYILVGSDDGIIIYRRWEELVGGMFGSNIFYIKEGKLVLYNVDNRKTKDYGRLKEKLLRLIPKDSNTVIAEYEKYRSKDEIKYTERECKYEIIGPDGVNSRNKGYCIYVNNDIYELRDKVLLKNGKEIKKSVSGVLFANKLGIFVVDGKKITVKIIKSNNRNDQNEDQNYSVKNNKSDMKYQNNLINKQNPDIVICLSFIPCDIVASDSEIAIIGKRKIEFYDIQMKLKFSIDENLEIIGGIYAKSTDGLNFFIYTTLRSIKYFYGESGILLSVNDYVKPLGFYKDQLYSLIPEGFKKFALDLNEIRFKKFVCEGTDKNILEFIENNNLPGIAPLEYLIKQGKGAFALPYIRDDFKKYELYLSSGKFEDAYDLCTNDDMIRNLAFHAMSKDKYDVAENCFKEIDDKENLLFFFICTKQLDKIPSLYLQNIIVGIVLEDRNLVNEYFNYEIFKSKSVEETNNVNEKNKF